MRLFFSIIFVLVWLSIAVFPATYYVDNTCANNGDGTAATCAASPGAAGAFNSITNMCAATFAPGDTILLKRGQTYYETLSLQQAGTAGSPITISAYGSGDVPRISGANLLNYEWSTPDEIISNGNLERWSAGTPGGWTKTLAGTSTITQSTTVKENGNSAVCFTIDAGGDNVTIQQNTSAIANSTGYSFSLWHKIPVGKTGWIRVRNVSTFNRYLKSDGSWTAGNDGMTMSGTGNWTQFSMSFTSESTNNSTYEFKVFSLSAASSVLYYDNFHFATTVASGSHAWFTAPADTVPHNVWFNRAVGNKVASVGALANPGDWVVSGINIYTYCTQDPSTYWISPGVESDARVNPGVVNTSYVTLDNLWISESYGHGCWVSQNNNSTSGVTIQNCVVDYCNNSGICVGSGINPQDHFVVQNCRVSTNGSTVGADHGIYLKDAGIGSVQSNVISGHPFGNAVVVQSSAGAYSNTNTVRWNQMIDNSGGVIVFNNGGGMPYENQIYSNLISGTTNNGIAVSGTVTAGTNYFWNNTVVNNGAAGHPFSMLVASVAYVTNNIFWTPSGASVQFPTVSGVTSDHNLIGPEGTSFITWHNTNYNTLAAYVSASSMDTHSISSDPLFRIGTDIPLWTSPALEKGADVGLTVDLLGNPIVGTPDLGAYEYQHRVRYAQIGARTIAIPE